MIIPKILIFNLVTMIEINPKIFKIKIINKYKFNRKDIKKLITKKLIKKIIN